MECSAPKPTGIDREEIRDATQHLASSFVREREQQNISRINAVFEQIRHAIREGARFPGAGTSYHKERSGRRSYGRKLLFIELCDVIHMDRRGYRGALQRVLPRHVRLPTTDWRLRKRTAAKRIAQTCARKIVRD